MFERKSEEELASPVVDTASSAGCIPCRKANRRVPFQCQQTKETRICDCNGSLLAAAGTGCLKCVRELLPQADRDDADGEKTALMAAAMAGHTDIVAILAQHQAGRQRRDGTTALLDAAAAGHLESVKILLPLEGHLSDCEGCTALMVAVRAGHLGVAQFLLPFQGGVEGTEQKTATLEAVKANRRECWRVLRCDAREVQTASLPAVMCAAFEGDLRYLSAHRESWGGKYQGEWLPLDFAIRGGNLRAVRLLSSTSQHIRPAFALCCYIQQRENHHVLTLKHALEIVLRQFPGELSGLICNKIASGQAEAVRLLRPLCAPQPGRLFQALRQAEGRNEAVVGMIPNAAGVAGVETFGTNLNANPLRAKQAELARRQLQRRLAHTKNRPRAPVAPLGDEAAPLPAREQFGFREALLECSFNKNAFLEARKTARVAITPEVVRSPREETHLRRKQQRAALLYREGIRFFVRSMEQYIADL